MSLISPSLYMDLGILVLGLIGLLYWITSRNYGHWRKKGVYYLEPKAFFGNVGTLVTGKQSMGEVLSDIYSKSKGKPYVGMFAFHKPVLLINDLDLVKSVLVKDFSHFRDRNFGVYEEKDSIFGKNLFAIDGQRWRHLRIKLTPTFTSGKMKNMYEFVNECGLDLINYLDKNISGGEGVLEVKDAFARYTTDVIASCGFGVKCNSLQNPDAEFRRILGKVFEFEYWKAIKSSLVFFAPDVLRTFRMQVWDQEITDFMRRAIWDTVRERKRTGYVRKDFLDLLMQLKDKGFVDTDSVSKTEDNKIGNGTSNGVASPVKWELDGDDFVAQAFVFLIAGFETSSSTLTFCMYELARNPEHQDRLRAEVREAMSREGPKLSYETLQGLPFMAQVVQETLRLYPIVPFLDRQVVEDYQIPNTNVVLERKSTIMISLMGIHRDPEYFEEPNAFRPERFSEENKARIPQYAYMPFGEGPRICIGMRMGYMQVKVGLAHIINSFSFAPSAKTVIPLHLDPKSFVLATKGGMPLKVTKLKDAVL